MAKYGSFKYSYCKYGVNDCGTYVEVVMVKNISKTAIRIYVEPGDMFGVSGWSKLGTGQILTAERDNINVGWLDSLRARGMIRIDEINYQRTDL